MPNFSQITLTLYVPHLSNYTAPSGPGMSNFSQITLILYALHLSNYAAPSGPGMPIFFTFCSIFHRLLNFSSYAAPNGSGMPNILLITPVKWIYSRFSFYKYATEEEKAN